MENTFPPIVIAPSILSADFSCLGREVKAVEDAGGDRIHCDVMDGCFVRNLTFGPLIVEAVRRSVALPVDVHLMIVHPEKYLDAFCDAGAGILMFHAEACDNCGAALEKIKKKGVNAGVAVNPDKSLELFSPFLDLIDQVLVMTVYAGLPAQKFLPDMLDKIARMREIAERRNPALDIEVDGGINEATIARCASYGANVFVAGSYVFGSGDYRGRIAALRAAALKGRKEKI
jgi:ribulose-phosphate 3-epimerase